MLRYLLPGLFSLPLLLAACSTKKDPAPPLEGNWTRTHQHIVTYNADGSVLADNGKVAPATVYDWSFAGTTLTENSNNLIYHYTYTYTGNRLTGLATDPVSPGNFEVRVLELTPDILTVESGGPLVQGGTISNTLYFIRR